MCGSAYDITIYSEQFKGKRTIQQHRLVTEVKSHMHTSVQLTWYIFFLQALFEKISMVIGEDIDDNYVT